VTIICQPYGDYGDYQVFFWFLNEFQFMPENVL